MKNILFIPICLFFVFSCKNNAEIGSESLNPTLGQDREKLLFEAMNAYADSVGLVMTMNPSKKVTKAHYEKMAKLSEEEFQKAIESAKKEIDFRVAFQAKTTGQGIYMNMADLECRRAYRKIMLLKNDSTYLEKKIQIIQENTSCFRDSLLEELIYWEKRIPKDENKE